MCNVISFKWKYFLTLPNDQTIACTCIGQIKNIVTFVKKKNNNIFDFDLLYILKFKQQFWKKKIVTMPLKVASWSTNCPSDLP